MRKPGIVKRGGDMCEVAVLRQSACGENCAHCKGGCTPTDTIIFAENIVGAKAGDRVVLEIPDKTGIKAAALVYLLPIIALITGALLAYSEGLSEGAVALISLMSMAAVILIVWVINKAFPTSFKVKVVDIIGTDEKAVE